jgi:hypothetical protein
VKPPKYPDPPPGANVFDWIVRTAQAMRRKQSHSAEIDRSRRAAADREALRERARAADAAMEKRGPKGDRYWRVED